MIFKIKKHNSTLYNTLLALSRNLFFYKTINLTDTFETRVYLMFLHYSIILQIYKLKKHHTDQDNYDSLFHYIESNLRELGFGDVSVNKKMKDLNKIFYDMLLKINQNKQEKKFKINKKIIFKYFSCLDNENDEKFKTLELYLKSFYEFCFELSPDIMIRSSINFKF